MSISYIIATYLGAIVMNINLNHSRLDLLVLQWRTENAR